MTPRDAAHLLIAATCSQDVQDSVDTVHRYGKLPHSGKAVHEEIFPTLAVLGDQHSFADALTALLDGPSIRFLADDPKSAVSVTFTYPIPEVSLEIFTHSSGTDPQYRLPWLGTKTVPARVHVGDRRIRYTFSEQTIFTVGNLLRGED